VSGFSSQERQLLLELARESVSATAMDRRLPRVDLANLPERLAAPGASFVTLMLHGRLRGCIGTLQAVLPLAEDVILRASSAARDDPRFPPVSEPELAELQIEISVLSAPRPLDYSSPQQLLERLRPQVDGVVLAHGRQRATFLPQVWERVPDPVQFIEMLCSKAGLPADAWRTLPLEISTYQVESFEESNAG